MTTSDTRNVQATVDQVKRCADAGADLVRITVQGKREAVACHEIREQLFKDRCAPAASERESQLRGEYEPYFSMLCTTAGTAQATHAIAELWLAQ